MLLGGLRERRRQEIDNLSKLAEYRGEPERPSTDPHSVDEEVDQDPVTHAEAEEDTKVSPLVLWLDVERSHKVYTGGELAVPAIGSRVRVNEVAAGLIDEVLRIYCTGGSRRRVEICSFLRQAAHRSVVKGCG